MIAGFQGRLIDRDHEDYDLARRMWNGAYDRRPLLIAQCLDALDVRAAVLHAREHDLPIAVRGGGHSLAGHSVCDGGLVIDLRLMKGVTVDPKARIATVETGAKWGDFDQAVSAYELGTPGGDTSTVGVAGLTLGGGLGWLSRMYGMTSDNLVGAELIDACGEILHVDEASHPDLLWGLRGGGGNFGVVTELRFALHPVPPILLAGVLHYPASSAVEVLGELAALTPSLPDEVSWAAAFLTASNSEAIPRALRGKPMLAVRVCYVGNPDDKAAAALAPVRALGTTMLDTVAPMAYATLQQLTDANAPAGLPYASASEWLRQLDRRTIECFVAAGENATSPMSLSLINPMGGAIASRPADATAFAYRHAAYATTIVAGWASPDDDPRPHRAWSHQLWKSLLPASAGGGYVNILGDEDHERVRSAYGERTYARLVGLKDRYDPTNVFSYNQNIRPSRKDSRR
jgi:FAD/FMN-containing dehydrogenase